jgi:hypothetical protein
MKTFLRTKKGALTAEYLVTIFVLLMFLFFPLLNLASCLMRGFFLWFACEQAVMSGSKAKTLSSDITISGTKYKSAYNLARDTASHLKTAFPGVKWNQTATNPKVEISLQAIPNSTPVPPYVAPFVCTGPGISMAGVNPDVDKYVVMFKVSIEGEIDPLMPMQLMGLSIPGLSSSMKLKVQSQSLFENPPGISL